MKELKSEKKVESLIENSLSKIRDMVDVNCVIGDLVSLPDGSSLIPISKVSVGFISGAGEYNDLNSKRNNADFPMSGGTGGGYSVKPIGFFLLQNGKYKLIHADKSSAYLSLLKSIGEIAENISKNKKNK